MTGMPLRMSLSAADLPMLLAALHLSPLLPATLPLRLSVDSRLQPASSNWLERAIASAHRTFLAVWDEDYEQFLSYATGTIVKLGEPAAAPDAIKLLSALQALPFSLASVEDSSPAFLENPDYPGPGFSGMHFPLGWACAFKGDGHRRLVSRRWLDFGPWRLTRGANDTSLVQFYDVNADPETAWKQSEPGHERMGYTDTGGFIPSSYKYSRRVDGLYDRDERRLRYLVHGRDVTQLEMLDACAVRLNQALGPERPLDSVAYVFAVETEARAHLHELWLRELECRTIIGGREVRLDTDYHPSPEKPEWVQAETH